MTVQRLIGTEFKTMGNRGKCFFFLFFFLIISGAISFQAGNRCIVHSSGIYTTYPFGLP